MIFYLSEDGNGLYKTKEQKNVNLIECRRVIGSIDGAIELDSVEEAISHFELTPIEN
ncbi:MAG: hypothetical protein ACRCXX_14185 [Cetobacterium sp.]|uniref:hypothetical protein n=1 Tax=Cetobacterium sp. TaxID=2071632 RepID=UPI003F36DCA4